VTSSIRTTPLVSEHERLGAQLVPFAGWKMPVRYAGQLKEHHAVRKAAGLFDVCHMGELRIRGAGALDAVNQLITNDLAATENGQALYTVCCNEHGGILDDLIVYRRAEDDILIVCNASNVDKIASHVQSHLPEGVSFDNESDDTALIAIQGPLAEATLRDAGGSENITGLSAFRIADGEACGVAVMAARTGYTGEDGFELFCRNADAVALWSGLLAAGEKHGVMAAGLGARDTLRLEAKLCLYGNDISEDTNPYEARLGWVVKLEAGPFHGRDALQAIKEQGVSRRLVGFEMQARGIARHGHPIVDLNSGEVVGTVTSGSPGPTLGKNIGLGYVPKGMAKIGQNFGVDIRGKVVEAVIVKTPFYRRTR